MTKSGTKSVKKGQKMMKKATNLVYNTFFKKNFVLANFEYTNGYNMMKKNWCHYVTLGVNFSHLVNFTGHFLIY